jgi:hypothetical protein
MNENLIVNDFLQDAVLVSQECLNSLPERGRRRMAEALEDGGEIEVRARLRVGAPVVSVWLFNGSGQAELIASSE